LLSAAATTKIICESARAGHAPRSIIGQPRSGGSDDQHDGEALSLFPFASSGADLRCYGMDNDDSSIPNE
jgi:hypothetical protein